MLFLTLPKNLNGRLIKESHRKIHKYIDRIKYFAMFVEPIKIAPELF